ATHAWMSTLITGIGTPTGIYADGSDLLVGQLESPTQNLAVGRYTVQPTPLAGSVLEGDNGLGRAQGMALAPDGTYYVSSNEGAPAILHYNASGTYLDTLPVAAAAPGTLVFGPNGHLYIGDLGLQTITEYDPTTRQVVSVKQLDYTPGGIAFTAD